MMKFLGHGIKELLLLLVPILIVLMTRSTVGFVEKIFLSQHAVEALEGTMQAIYIVFLFQLPTIGFANMIQVFLGDFVGKKQEKEIGRHVWQMIWCSLLSLFITYPLSQILKPFCFQGVVQAHAYAYYDILMLGNFLFPVGATLTAFYLSVGKFGDIVRASLLGFTLNFFLDLILISGVEGVIAPWGSRGAAVGICVGQTFFCALLLRRFLETDYREKFRTDKWKWDFSLIRDFFRLSMPRAGGRLIAVGIWSMATSMMALRGGEHALILAIGGAFILAGSFLQESLLQSMPLLASRGLAAQDRSGLRHLLYAGFSYTVLISLALSMPFCFFAEQTLQFFFPGEVVEATWSSLKLTAYWSWLWILGNGFNTVILSFLFGMRDMMFYLIFLACSWLITFALPYLAIVKGEWPAHTFWLVLAVDQFLVLGVYVIRVFWVSRRRFSWLLKKKELF